MLHGEICELQYPANCARIGDSPGTGEQCGRTLPSGALCGAVGLVCCCMLDGTLKTDGLFGQGKAQTTAIPVGIARICNAALVEKTRFQVPDSVQHDTSCPVGESVADRWA